MNIAALFADALHLLAPKRALMLCCMFMLGAWMDTNVQAQQQLGMFPNMDGGFENQVAGNVVSTRDANKWSFVVNGNGQSRLVSTRGGYGGGAFISVGKTASASSGATTTVNSNELTTNSFSANTLYVVQFFYKANAANVGTPDPASGIFLSADGTSALRITKNISLGTPSVWTKFTDTIRTNNNTNTTTATAGIIIRTPALGTAVVMDIDNFLVYPADNSTSGAPDLTAPNPVTNIITSLVTPIQQQITWSAPSGGVDNGGYLVVRYATNPASNDNPITNAIYAVGDTVSATNNGLVVYLGKNPICIDSLLLQVNTSYYYRIYAADKAFNYSAATTYAANTYHPPTNYYIDAISGNDNNAGTSTLLPWKSISKVNATTFYAGDSVLFKRGSVFTGTTLRPLGVGESGLPITIAAYGNGNLPLIAADGNGLHNESAVMLYNQQYITISSLEITNNYAATMADTVVRRGVYVLATDAGILRGITLKNLVIHDVLGTYDSDNESGGIFININGSSVVTLYDSLTVDGCNIYNVDRTGISNQSSWADRDMNNDYGSTPWRPSTNLVYKNNRIDSSGGNGMIVRVAQSPLVQNNIFWKCARRYSGNAFFVFNCNDALVQYNEAAFTVYNTNDVDASGFDGDYRCRRSIFQYNYSHDNDGGFAVVVCNPGGTPARFNDSCVFRYNISQNDGHFNGNIKNEGEIITVTGQTTNTFFYNNTIFSSTDFNYAIIHRRWGDAGSVYPVGTNYFNNIFYINKANPLYNLQSSTNNLFDYNLFYQPLGGTPPTDAHIITTSPNCINPGAGGVGINTVAGYQISTTSPCINAGRTVANAPNRDYFGNTLPQYGGVDIGAHEFTCTAFTAPSISITTSSTTVCTGASTLFTANITNGGSTPVYQWKKNSINVGSNTSTYTDNNLANGDTITCMLTVAGLCFSPTSITSNALIVSVAAIWQGGLSNNWFTAGNWCNNSVPTAATSVVIPTGRSIYPTITTGTANVNHLTINNGASLSVSGTLQIAGNITCNGTFNAQSGTIVLKGSIAQTIPANCFANKTIQHLTINNPTSVSIQDTLNLTGVLTPTNGTLLTNDLLILKSTSTATASVAQGVGNYLAGAVTVERFIPSKLLRKYSFVGSPVEGVSLRNSWQQQIYISGNGTGGQSCGSTLGNGGSTDQYNSNGFDKTQTNTPSVYTYNASPTSGTRWSSIPNTSATALSLGKGYRINIRGDRKLGSCSNQLNSNTPSAPTSVVLSAKGNLGKGTIQVALNPPATHLYTLLSNPYPSTLSFSAFQADNAAMISNKMWTYSPSGNGNYTTYLNGIIANAASGYDNTTGNFLASGQAFFVEAINSSAANTIQFKEVHKSTTTPPNHQYFGIASNNLLRMALYTSDSSMADEIVLQFAPHASPAYLPNQDALSFGEGSQQLVCFKQNYPLAIAAFPDTSVDYTIPLGINSNKTGAFYFAFSELPSMGYPTNFWLKDAFLGTITPIDAQTKHYFTITGDTASKGKHRFKLWVQKATVLANSTNIQLKATVLNETIRLQWQDHIVTSKEYRVERSADGHHFYPLSSVLSRLITHYEDDALANHPEQFVFYYRIKVITTTNAPVYSNVASVQLRPNAAFSARVITSPTEQSLITIQLQNERPNSHYAINIYGVAGTLVKQFVCTDENRDHRLQLSIDGIATGIYSIEIVQNQQEKQVLKWWKK